MPVTILPLFHVVYLRCKLFGVGSVSHYVFGQCPAQLDLDLTYSFQVLSQYVVASGPVAAEIWRTADASKGKEERGSLIHSDIKRKGRCRNLLVKGNTGAALELHGGREVPGKRLKDVQLKML